MTDEGIGAEELAKLFSFTRSSSLNELITEAKKIYEDDFDPDFFIDDYRDKLQNFRELTEKLREYHSNLKKVQEDVPVITEQSELIANKFEEIFEGMQKMEEYLEYREKEKIVEGLKILKAANEAIFTAIDIVSKEQSALEQYSKSPYVHELIRLARGVESKGFPKEQLKERLDWMLGYCEGISRDFQIYKTSKFETAAIQEKMPEVEEALAKYREGLLLLEEYISDDESQKIEEGIKMISEGSSVIIDAYQLIQRELQTSSAKHCVQCGQGNELTAKYCSKCSALLPETQQTSDVSSLDVTISSSTGINGAGVMTSNMIMLTDAVNNYTEGRTTDEALLQVIEWMEEKVRETINELQNMGPPESAEDEANEDLMQVGELFEQGTYEMESALATMRMFFESGEAAYLQEGLQAAQEAGQKLYQVQERCKFASSGT